MNEETKLDYMHDKAFAVNVLMKGAEPTAEGYIVDKDDAVAEPPVLTNAKKLVTIAFGDGVEGVTFYGPDGGVLFSDKGEGNKLPSDEVIHEAMNFAWTGDPGSELMGKVQIAMLQVVGHILVAKQTADATGAPAQAIFESLSVHDQSLPSRVYKSDKDGQPIAKLATINPDEENA